MEKKIRSPFNLNPRVNVVSEIETTKCIQVNTSVSNLIADASSLKNIQENSGLYTTEPEMLFTPHMTERVLDPKYANYLASRVPDTSTSNVIDKAAVSASNISAEESSN